MEKPEENMVNAGIIFMFSVWLQSQMSDLIIFKKNPDLVDDFVKNPKKVPKATYAERVKYWERQFGQVKEEFVREFSDLLTESEKADIEEIYHVRNMIAHAHVSVGRNYMLFRPHGGEKREQQLIEALRLQPIEDQSDPIMIKLEFWRPDLFKRLSGIIERIDQSCLKKIATSLGVPHGRIR